MHNYFKAVINWAKLLGKIGKEIDPEKQPQEEFQIPPDFQFYPYSAIPLPTNFGLVENRLNKGRPEIIFLVILPSVEPDRVNILLP